MQPREVEKIKDFCESFGFETYALPDLSTSMDGYFGEQQGKLAQGGIGIDEIETLGNSTAVISIGNSMKIAAKALLEKNPKIEHLHFDHLMGQDMNDNFVAALMEIREIDPSPLVKRWRGRLQDAMLDTHFLIGSSRFVITGEPDMCVGIAELLQSVGGTIEAVVSTVYSPVLETIEAENVFVGDLEDAKNHFKNADLVISNFHAERLLHIDKQSHAGLVLRGFPNYEELGNQLKNDQLYEGSTYFLFEVANKLQEMKHHG
jgi:nitrogenase molybdenum-iron protein NifN